MSTPDSAPLTPAPPIPTPTSLETPPVPVPTLDSVFDALEHAITVRDNAASASTTALAGVEAAVTRLETANTAATAADISVADAILAKNAAIDTVVAFLNGMRESV